MTARPSNQTDELTLDPSDWDAMRQLGHRMVDDMMTWLETVRERPVWQPIPEAARAAFRRPAPREAEGPEAAYQDFLTEILPHPMGNVHPRFWAWVIGTGTPLGALSEMLAATMNPNVGSGDQIASQVERQVVEWCAEMLGFPTDSSGILVSGGSMANLIGLAVARNDRAGFDIRRDGVRGAPGPLTLYGSVETHSSVQKAVELMGLGSAAFRQLPVNSDYEVDVDAVASAIAADRAAGCRPFCVVGNAGTVNTGATDDLQALAELCRREGLWFHVDGAFGAIAYLAPALRSRLAGMELADSIAFDLHKWMYVPFEAGCTLVRRRSAHHDTFALTPGYLAHEDRGLAGGDLWFSEYGIQLSRGFRALKIWMSFKEHGLDRYGELVQQNVDQAGYLARLVEEAPDLELAAPAPLNVVCFRYIGGPPGTDLDAVNREVLMRLHESGVAVPSYATLQGRYAIRVAITNHRSRREDFELLVSEVRRLGAELTG